MDLWPVHVKNSSGNPAAFLWVRNYSIPEKPAYWNLRRHNLSSSSSSYGHYHRSSWAVRAMAAKKDNANNNNDDDDDDGDGSNSSSSSSPGNGGRSNPQGDGPKANHSSDSNKSSDRNSQKSHHVNGDWREFRANLVAWEQAEHTEGEAHNQGGTPQQSKSLGRNWAHPIAVPETGCVLVATEKLDGVRTFERTVVLLLRSGTRHPQEGPFGVVINRPLNKRIKHMKPTNHELATTFADCSLHFGGPLEASMFLLKTGEKAKLPGFEMVIPGLCFGARNSLDEAATLVRKGVLEPRDFRFFVGYAGWQLDQLREEIESEYWYVAACSSNLIYGATSESDSSSESLWEEILLLMGSPYSELSRKPKQDI